MNFDNLNPFIRYASLHNFYNHFKKDRVCYDCRLFLVTQGDGTLTANGENFNLSDNTLIYFPPNTHYSFNFKNSILFDCAARHVGCQLPDQGSNLRPLQWKRGVLRSVPLAP